MTRKKKNKLIHRPYHYNKPFKWYEYKDVPDWLKVPSTEELKEQFKKSPEYVALHHSISHINATPKFLSNPDNVKMINNMVDKASKMMKDK